MRHNFSKKMRRIRAAHKKIVLTLLKINGKIKNIAGIEIDHSFLNYKKELIRHGYQVGKISLKEKIVLFNKIEIK
jgi:hypothetical protein